MTETAKSKETGKSSIMQWLGGSGEEVLHNAVTVMMCGAAAHAIYLAAAPEPLRVPIAVRSAPLWKRISVGALVCVAVYDGWQSRQLAKEASALAAQVKDLNSKLLQSE